MDSLSSPMQLCVSTMMACFTSFSTAFCIIFPTDRLMSSISLGERDITIRAVSPKSWHPACIVPDVARANGETDSTSLVRSYACWMSESSRSTSSRATRLRACVAVPCGVHARTRALSRPHLAMALGKALDPVFRKGPG